MHYKLCTAKKSVYNFFISNYLEIFRAMDLFELESNIGFKVRSL